MELVLCVCFISGGRGKQATLQAVERSTWPYCIWAAHRSLKLRSISVFCLNIYWHHPRKKKMKNNQTINSCWDHQSMKITILNIHSMVNRYFPGQTWMAVWWWSIHHFQTKQFEKIRQFFSGHTLLRVVAQTSLRLVSLWCWEHDPAKTKIFFQIFFCHQNKIVCNLCFPLREDVQYVQCRSQATNAGPFKSGPTQRPDAEYTVPLSPQKKD